MSKVSVIVKLITQEGKRDDLVAAFAEYLPTVEAEEGTLVYSLSTDAGDENVTWVFEVYTDGDAMKAHSTSDAFKAFSAKLGDLMGGAPEFHMTTPAVAKGHAV